MRSLDTNGDLIFALLDVAERVWEALQNKYTEETPDEGEEE